MTLSFSFTNMIVNVQAQAQPQTEPQAQAQAQAQDQPNQIHLALGDINVLVLTDVHSWVAGHLPHEPTNDANYGDVLSFYERLKQKCHDQQKDLFFVMNGDFTDGTGLSTYPPEHLTPILQKMPWDAINIGNHELYRNSTVEFISQPNGFVDYWRGRYLTSNVLKAATGKPIGHRYRFLHAPRTNKTILTFGFLYNFINHCPITTVEDVQNVVESDWFNDVLLQQQSYKFDAILVLAHMHYVDPLVNVILDRIRQVCGPDMPVQFVTGHSHIRANQQLDYYSSSFEAGKYLDTIGLISFPTKDLSKVKATSSSNGIIESSASTAPSIYISPLSNNTMNTNEHFKYLFIDTTVAKMEALLEVRELRTPNGTILSNLIHDTQNKLGLFEILGCAPMTYYLGKGQSYKDSLRHLFMNLVIPQQLFTYHKQGNPNMYIQNVGAFRYNLYEGNVSLTDLISTSPYNDTLYLVSDNIKGEYIMDAFMDAHGFPPKDNLAFSIIDSDINANQSYKVFVPAFDLDYIVEQLSTVTEQMLSPVILDNVTTSKLWIGYINDTWPCPIDELVEDAQSFLEGLDKFFQEQTALKVIAFILTCIFIACYGWMIVCRSHNVTANMNQGSDSESESHLSIMDDLSVGEFSSSQGTSQAGSGSVYGSKAAMSPQQYPAKRTHNAYHSVQGLENELI